jgi:hypothetical protein
MAKLTRDKIKTVVIDTLTIIADIPGDSESSGFGNLTNEQKHLFLSALKSKLNALPYYMNDGSSNHLAYYDIDLTPDSVDEWPKMQDCINWILQNQKIVYL